MVWGVRDQQNLVSMQTPLPLPKHDALYLDAETCYGVLPLESNHNCPFTLWAELRILKILVDSTWI